MARLCYATEVQLAELIRLSRLPDSAPPAGAFRMFAHAPALGAATLKLVFALLTETARTAVLEQFNLANADELDLDSLVARMETETLAYHSQLIGPLQFGAWTRKP